VSHELKNPVAAIRASAEVLEDAIVNDAEAALNFSKRIIESSKKMESLIRDLLSLAQLEARGIGASVKSLDIVTIAKTSVDDLHDVALERGVQIKFHFGGEAHLKGDAVWIRRAIDNLLINALHFAPEKSVVAVCLSRVDEGIEIAVTDSGPGIDPSLGASVFERFVTSRKAEGGTGLGMAIVRAVAEAHGGMATIIETGPNGTTVAFTLHRVF
jgi:signal transduction histidine kinase